MLQSVAVFVSLLQCENTTSIVGLHLYAYMSRLVLFSLLQSVALCCSLFQGENTTAILGLHMYIYIYICIHKYICIHIGVRGGDGAHARGH